MLRWVGKVAVVTGASTGIGAAIAEELVKQRITVVGIARREDKLKELAIKCDLLGGGEFHGLKCDVSIETEVVETFSRIKKNIGVPVILINNAGVLVSTTVLDATASDLQKMLCTNLQGQLICSREAVKSMLEREIDDGHIIHINGISSRGLIQTPGVSEMGVYCATKHACAALTLALREELRKKKSNIKITDISPSITSTEMTAPLGFPEGISLDAKHVANACVSVLNTPPKIEISELVIRCTGCAH